VTVAGRFPERVSEGRGADAAPRAVGQDVGVVFAVREGLGRNAGLPFAMGGGAKSRVSSWTCHDTREMRRAQGPAEWGGKNFQARSHSCRNGVIHEMVGQGSP